MQLSFEAFFDIISTFCSVQTYMRTILFEVLIIKYVRLIIGWHFVLRVVSHETLVATTNVQPMILYMVKYECSHNETHVAATVTSNATRKVCGIASSVVDSIVSHFLWHPYVATLTIHFNKLACSTQITLTLENQQRAFWDFFTFTQNFRTWLWKSGNFKFSPVIFWKWHTWKILLKWYTSAQSK